MSFLLWICMSAFGAGDAQQAFSAVPSSVQSEVDANYERVQFEFEGIRREFFVHVPKGAQGKLKALIVLHGGKHNIGVKMMPSLKSKLNTDVVLVFPTGWYEKGVNSWATSQSLPEDPARDVRFLEEITRRVVADYSVDASKVYLSGFSAGGAMVWEVMCSDSPAFAGYAMVAKGLFRTTETQCKSGLKKPAVFVVGTSDRNFEGYSEMHGGVESRDFLMKRNGCSGAVVSERHFDVDPSDRKHADLVRYACKEAPVEYIVVSGGGHSWPGSGGPRRSDHSLDFQFTDELFAFFEGS